MASIPTSPNAPSRPRESYVLSVQREPLDCSVPAPLDSPPPSRPPSSGRGGSSQNNRPRLSRPPTPGGGPLSSHPAHDWTTSPGTWPPTPEAERASFHKTSSIDTNGISTSIAADSLHSPLTPLTPSTTTAAAPPIMEHSHSYQQRAPVRRLFSLTSLRQSFSSSRASLSLRPDTSHGNYQAAVAGGRAAPPPPPSSSSYQHIFSSSSSSYRAQSPSLMSTATSCMAPPPSSRFSHEPHPRPSTASAATATTSTSALLRKKRSSTWFNSVKRKSQIFGMPTAAEDAGNLDVLDENGPEHKRFKDHPMPTLPEIDALSGGSLEGGSLGWDDQLFKRS
ncbi:uncharacterized protein SEPMUDRAFT_150227 [Sphaerulina musiva SO2202]|uniref:Uncharacterized protein n=1 Tax=Sphaerulina musiva (strain SO2202) TaxID=692275 RepID=M3AWZ0_SPHMS|nr:uncharacterized protein SEPMUDRAFT_150227 [Sphaerulina musiva SO2202]EMF11245.1 hypothetical protein SEPMUDRAFT_150227 [Sphaerulina musiva SO2202]